MENKMLTFLSGQNETHSNKHEYIYIYIYIYIYTCICSVFGINLMYVLQRFADKHYIVVKTEENFQLPDLIALIKTVLLEQLKIVSIANVHCFFYKKRVCQRQLTDQAVHMG